MFVHDLALVVHDIVVFDNLFADIVVARLDFFLCGFNRFGHPSRRRQRFAVFEVGAHHLGEHGVGAEDAQQLVIKAEIKPRQAGVTLTTRASAQLVVDATALVAFGTEHEQTPGGDDPRLVLGNFGLDLGDGDVAFRPSWHIAQLVFNPELDIAAELDVGTATRHVCRNRDRADTAGLGHDMGFALMEAGVEYLVFDTLRSQELTEEFGLFNRHGPDKNWLSLAGLFGDRLGDPLKFVVSVLVKRVFLIDPCNRDVGRNCDDIHLVDLMELGRLGRCRTGHAPQLWIHPEIILESD